MEVLYGGITYFIMSELDLHTCHSSHDLESYIAIVTMTDNIDEALPGNYFSSTEDGTLKLSVAALGAFQIQMRGHRSSR
jgi:hypothetical protein